MPLISVPYYRYMWITHAAAFPSKSQHDVMWCSSPLSVSMCCRQTAPPPPPLPMLLCMYSVRRIVAAALSVTVLQGPQGKLRKQCLYTSCEGPRASCDSSSSPPPSSRCRWRSDSPGQTVGGWARSHKLLKGEGGRDPLPPTCYSITTHIFKRMLNHTHPAPSHSAPHAPAFLPNKICRSAHIQSCLPMHLPYYNIIPGFSSPHPPSSFRKTAAEAPPGPAIPRCCRTEAPDSPHRGRPV